ncbi:MAG: hypothetical protein SBU_000132 [Candidatus Syntrophoarchaeum butanivorans]|uniref:Uncharacterized protein n=1 Tax=Candidatus Syntropharchaeum butanivorans TaxID=1839936 RepID=A0A1F2P677_9EURY|nr:MAG: hypothetical protein SBU_000132 [Candidatus Syntrophoarchaeum butanivorans]
MDCPVCGHPLGNDICPVTHRVACTKCCYVLTDEEMLEWLEE